jgi:hypothetical protein
LNVSLRKPFDNSNLNKCQQNLSIHHHNIHNEVLHDYFQFKKKHEIFYRLSIRQNSRYSIISLIWTIITTSRSNTWLKAKIIVFARSEYNVAHYTKIQLVQNVRFGSINFFFQNHLLSFWKIKSFILENMSQFVLNNYTLHPITKKIDVSTLNIWLDWQQLKVILSISSIDAEWIDTCSFDKQKHSSLKKNSFLLLNRWTKIM